jgi:protein-disulfide isomerase
MAAGLLITARPPEREQVEHAASRFRAFRQSPLPDVGYEAKQSLQKAVSLNERLQTAMHPWTSFVIVPIFALANAGVDLRDGVLGDALTSPVTWGVVLGLVVGKLAGIGAGALGAVRLGLGRLPQGVGSGQVVGGAALSGIGFTVSLLIATLAFSGERLEEAKVGILAAAVCATLLTWVVFRVTAMLPRRRKLAALLGTAEPITDLAVDVDPERDHIRGSAGSKVTLVEYGDFECPYCGMAEPIVRELQGEFTDVCYVWRHLPLSDVHAHAQQAAEAAEAAGAQGAFWEMHDLLLTRQGALRHADLLGYAEQLGLDVEQFSRDLTEHVHAPRIAADVDSADLSGVSGTPTFFVNGRRHYGAYDIETLSTAVRAAGAQAALAAK